MPQSEKLAIQLTMLQSRQQQLLSHMLLYVTTRLGKSQFELPVSTVVGERIMHSQFWSASGDLHVALRGKFPFMASHFCLSCRGGHAGTSSTKSTAILRR